MSDVEEQESTMDAFLDAVHKQNLVQSRSHFDNLMGQKIGAQLDAEKIAVASSIYGLQDTDVEELEAEADELKQSASDEYEELESEIEGAFVEDEYTEDEEPK